MFRCVVYPINIIPNLLSLIQKVAFKNVRWWRFHVSKRLCTHSYMVRTHHNRRGLSNAIVHSVVSDIAHVEHYETRSLVDVSCRGISWRSSRHISLKICLSSTLTSQDISRSTLSPFSNTWRQRLKIFIRGLLLGSPGQIWEQSISIRSGKSIRDLHGHI